MNASTDAEHICQKAREFIRKRQFAEAIGVYEQLLTADPRDIRAHEGIATAAFLSQDYDRAIEHFKRLAQLDVRRADPLVNLGAVYNRKGDFNEAVRVLRQALTKNRKCAEAYYNLGIAHKGQGQLSMAVSAYKEAVRLDPEMPEAYQNLGNAYLEMGNIQQALNNFRRALAINPRFERAQRGLDAALRQAQLNSTESNPFGRLVNLGQAAPQVKAASMVIAGRAMSDDERMQDRAVVHRIAAQFETQAGHLIDELKQRLGPALLTLMHAMSANDKHRLMTAHEELVAALELHWQALGPISKLADDLQGHEDQLRRQLADAV